MLDALLPSPESNVGLGASTLEAIFISALIWSVGAGLLEDGREKFDAFIKRLSQLPENSDDKAGVPAGELPVSQPTLYEYFFDREAGKWVPWEQVSLKACF